MAEKREEILEGILQLPVLDVAWLVKELEEKFGVSAAAPVAVAAAPAAAAALARDRVVSTFRSTSFVAHICTMPTVVFWAIATTPAAHK